MNLLKAISTASICAFPFQFQALTLHTLKSSTSDRSCPERFPVCGKDGDCMIASCSDGSCVSAWINGQNYINGYDGSGLDCVAESTKEDEQHLANSTFQEHVAEIRKEELVPTPLEENSLADLKRALAAKDAEIEALRAELAATKTKQEAEVKEELVALTLQTSKRTVSERSCPEHFPVCGEDGDCMIASCSDGSCVGAWINGQNYINGYDGSGLDCVAKSTTEAEDVPMPAEEHSEENGDMEVEEDIVVPTPMPTESVEMRDRFTSICTATENQEIQVFDRVLVTRVSMMASKHPSIENVSLLATSASIGMHGINLSAAGDKWLVKSGRVLIQAHYVQNDNSVNLQAIAISGAFLKGNTLVIGSLENKITWNGQEILKDRPSNFDVQQEDFFVNAVRHDHSSLVQDLSVENPGVNIEFPMGVSLIVNRLPGHVNAAVKMPPMEGGQDGLCGNFNGFPADDSWELVSERFDSHVPPKESLFVTETVAHANHNNETGYETVALSQTNETVTHANDANETVALSQTNETVTHANDANETVALSQTNETVEPVG